MASTEAPARPRARSKVEVAPSDFFRIVKYLSDEVLVEWATNLKVITRGVLSGTNTHLLGEPGNGKSYGLREYANCIDGATYFEKQLNASLPPDAVIGGIDIEALATRGEYKRIVAGFLPLADIGLIDEIFRGNGIMNDALLPILNVGERQYEANGGMLKSPLMAAFTASNHVPLDDEQAEALVDRVTQIVHVERIKSDASFIDMLWRRQAYRRGEVQAKRETITLAQLVQAQAEVRAVELAIEFASEFAHVRREIHAAGIFVSDRRYGELTDVARAEAWLQGRDALIPADLAGLEPGLARQPSEVATVKKILMAYQSELAQKTEQFRQELAPLVLRWHEVKPAVENTPPNERIPHDPLNEAVSLARQLSHLRGGVEKLLAEAGDHESTGALDELHGELIAIVNWYRENRLEASFT
jgi:MoxR-like ATPase